MAGPDPMDTPNRVGGREVVAWAPDESWVAALGTLCRHVTDPDERRELALMLGYGEPEVRERYENGLRAILARREAARVSICLPAPESRSCSACAASEGPSGGAG